MSTPRPTRNIVAALVAFVVGAAAVAAMSGAHAESPQGVDRALIERLVRAEEAQVRALEALTRATERCKR